MLKNYILVALRQLWKNKFYSGLNIIGLVAGISCFVLITLYISHDLQFDRYHEKKDRIYRLALGSLEDGQPRSAVSGGVMPHTLQANYAGIEKVVRFRKLPSYVAVGDKTNFEEKFFFTDSTVFDVFTFPLREGNPHTALVEPYSLVLTQNAAVRYFGRTENVIGQLLQVDESMTFKVTGVLEPVPDFSHFKFDFLASASTLPLHPQEPVRTYQLTGWFAHYFYNYILLDEKADAGVVSKNIREAHKTHADPEQYKLYGSQMGLYLQPLTDAHLNPLYGELEPQGDTTVLYILAGVAAMILLLACINYANLNTALTFGRRKEIGLRKTLGAARVQVMKQFLGESFLMCMVAFVIGLGLVEFLLPQFNLFTGKRIEWTDLFQVQTLGVLVAAIAFTALLGGIYPSLMARRFSPASILKGLAPNSRKFGFRKSVMVFQFVVSMVLVAGALVITTQVKHMLNKDLGLDTQQVLTIPLHGDPAILSRMPVFFEHLNQIPSVQSHALCELIPGETIYGIIATFEGHDNINFRTLGVGYGYLETFKLQLAAGRDFSPDQPQDTLQDNVIINEAMVRYLGWKTEDAVGKIYDRGGDGEHPGVVIGVLKDFNFNSLRTAAGPLVLAYSPNFFDKAVIRLQPAGNWQASIDRVKEAWTAVFPSRPFDFYFADESVQNQYQAEKKFGSLFAFFSALAILIGALGLFGMVSLDLNYRTKEVGIRKVLGASLNSLVSLLSRDFLILIVVALVLSLPVSWYLSTQWLKGFAYRITSIEWLIVLPAAGVVLLALLAVAMQTLRSALANPVDSLRNE